MDPKLISGLRTAFAEVFAGAPPRVAFAPGRVNLIGEHTDYNDGFVLPMAISRGVAVAFRPRTDRVIRAYSTSLGATTTMSLDDLDSTSRTDWAAYIAGVAWALTAERRDMPGLDLCVAADLPIGAGLSSSAAIEVAVARAFAAAGGWAFDPVQAARLCQRAENEFVGVQCGVMDQFASAASEEGCALLLDCRSLRHEPVPIPDSAVVVVMDTGVRRRLTSGAYNDRRAACDAAVTAVRAVDPAIRALRDVDAALLERAKGGMTDMVFQRARHVVAENVRPVLMADALRQGDLAAAGALMNDSHASLRDLFEVSCPELDLLAGIARRHGACFGTRMTGAGFGGCAVALVDRGGSGAFAGEVVARYGAESGLPTWAWTCEAEAGASLVDERRA